MGTSILSKFLARVPIIVSISLAKEMKAAMQEGEEDDNEEDAAVAAGGGAKLHVRQAGGDGGLERNSEKAARDEKRERSRRWEKNGSIFAEIAAGPNDRSMY